MQAKNDLDSEQEKVLKMFDEALEESPVLQKLVDFKVKKSLMQLKCHICKRKYDPWQIPSNHWKKLPEILWDKCLCYDCYLEAIG